MILQAEDQQGSANGGGKDTMNTKESNSKALKSSVSAANFTASPNSTNQPDCSATTLPVVMDSSPPGFYLGEKTFNIMVAGIVLAISLLIYRRLYLL